MGYVSRAEHRMSERGVGPAIRRRSGGGWGSRRRTRRPGRAVSDILAALLLVAITVVLAAVLYVLVSGLSHGPGTTPIGSAFAAAHPSTSNTLGTGGAADTCLAASTTTVALAIVPTHWTYTLTIESSTVTFGSVVFQVKTGAGAVANPAGAGGFYVVNITGNVVACVLPVATNGGLTMGGAAQFTYISATGITPSSSLTNLYTIVIDVGTARPTGSGYTFDALGQGSYSGVTGPLMLP